MLKTVVMFNVFVETVIHFFQDSLLNRKFKEQNWFQIELFCKIINAFIVTFDQIKIIIKNKNLTDPKLILNSSKIVFIILLLLLLSASDGYSKDEPVTHFY